MRQKEAGPLFLVTWKKNGGVHIIISCGMSSGRKDLAGGG